MVWDWNGTLYDDLSLVISCTGDVLSAYGFPALTFEQYRTAHIHPDIELYSALLGRPVGAAEMARIRVDFESGYQRRMAEARLAADAMAALTAWSAHGTQSVLSLSPHEQVVAAVRRLGLYELFARVDGRTRPELGRKAADLVRHLAALGVEPGSVLVVGDSRDDVAAAAHVGARCVLYAGGLYSPAMIDGFDVPVADSLAGALAHALGSRPGDTPAPAGGAHL